MSLCMFFQASIAGMCSPLRFESTLDILAQRTPTGGLNTALKRE